MSCKFEVPQLILDWITVQTPPLQDINNVVLRAFLCSFWPVFRIDVLLKHKLSSKSQSSVGFPSYRFLLHLFYSFSAVPRGYAAGQECKSLVSTQSVILYWFFLDNDTVFADITKSQYDFDVIQFGGLRSMWDDVICPFNTIDYRRSCHSFPFLLLAKRIKQAMNNCIVTSYAQLSLLKLTITIIGFSSFKLHKLPW